MAAADTWRAHPGVIRSQIVENCSFFSPPGAELSVILTRQPLGTYKAIILRAEPGGQREVLLSSESTDTVHRAFELLLVKSADAVQNYITTNGFEFAPCSKKVEDVVAEDDDDGVSSASSSEVLDDDLDKDLQDSTLSLSEAESAYESVSEDGVDARYPRARATHAYSMQVRRSRSPMLDDPSSTREGRQQRGPHCVPPHDLPSHRRRPSFARMPGPNAMPDMMGPYGPLVSSGAPPAAPPAAPSAPPTMHVGGAWRPGPMGMGQVPPAVPDVNTRNGRPEPAGMPRPHTSQFFSLHPPPPPGMKGGPPPPPASHPNPHPRTAAENVTQQHPHAKPAMSNGINRDTNGVGMPPPPMGMPPMTGMGMGMGIGMGMGMGMGVPPTQMPSYYHHQPLGPAAPPTPSTSSSSASSSPASTPTLAPSPNKPPSPPTPAPIDYRLCIRSRGPRAPGSQDGGAPADQQQKQKQQWHEQRIVVRSPPTRGHIRAAAMQFVDSHLGLFSHVYYDSALLNGSKDGSSGNQHQHRQQLGVLLSRVVLGDGETYDLSTYTGDDLSRLCAGAGAAAGQGAMPLFEVTVSNLEPFFTLSRRG